MVRVRLTRIVWIELLQQLTRTRYPGCKLGITFQQCAEVGYDFVVRTGCPHRYLIEQLAQISSRKVL
uniref:Putative secreted protein n=1 Tax=Anopheles marajoara TaxID=58244 RepID=A0A2M4CFP1_9DIPT